MLTSVRKATPSSGLLGERELGHRRCLVFQINECVPHRVPLHPSQQSAD